MLFYSVLQSLGLQSFDLCSDVLNSEECQTKSFSFSKCFLFSKPFMIFKFNHSKGRLPEKLTNYFFRLYSRGISFQKKSLQGLF